MKMKKEAQEIMRMFNYNKNSCLNVIKYAMKYADKWNILHLEEVERELKKL